jgi:hypothetical protein
VKIINTLFLSSPGVGACTMGDFAGVLLLRSDSFSWCEVLRGDAFCMGA